MKVWTNFAKYNFYYTQKNFFKAGDPKKSFSRTFFPGGAKQKVILNEMCWG